MRDDCDGMLSRDSATQPIFVIHIFLNLRVGGMEKIGSDLIIKQVKSGMRVGVVCLEDKGPFAERLESYGVEVDLLNVHGRGAFNKLYNLTKYLFGCKPDIVHTHNPNPMIWGGPAAWIARIPRRVHTKHGRNQVHLRKSRMFHRLSSVWYHKIVCVSEDIYNNTKNLEHVPSNKLEVIYNGVDLEELSSDQTDEVTVPNSKLIYASVARFCADKDHATLLHAWAERGTELPEAELWLIGDGELESEMRDLAVSLNISESVCFLGYRSDVTVLLRKADVFVLSTNTEGLSIALLEAMAIGLAIVATEVGGNSELLQHDLNGLLVDHKSVTSLTDAIRSIGQNKALRARIGHAAKQRVIQNFNLNKTLERYTNIYRS